MEQRKILVIAFILLLLGAVLPFLMIMGYIQATFPLVFITYGFSLIGLFLGMIGIAMYVGTRDRNQYYD